MTPRRRRPRHLEWDRLESRDCPAGAGKIAAPPPPAPTPTPPPPLAAATIPTERTDAMSRTAIGVYNTLLSAWRSDVAFFGDSIIYNFAYQAGVAPWARTMAPLAAVSLGIPGDLTQNLLWRLRYANELRNHPRVAVVEIGTNNLLFNGDGVAGTVAGIEAVVATIHELSPGTKVLLLGLLPSGPPGTPLRAQVAAINAAIAKLADGTSTCYLDIGPSLMDSAGSTDANFQPGLVHPNAAGYEIMATALLPRIDAMLNIAPPPPPIATPAPFITMVPPDPSSTRTRSSSPR